jgi:superfamily I DNA/RNA helicase
MGWCRPPCRRTRAVGGSSEAKRKKEEAEEERVFKEWEKELRRPLEESRAREANEARIRNAAQLKKWMADFEEKQAEHARILARLLHGLM